MRKNNKTALRVLSTATFLAMVASCTVPAFAGTYYLEKGDITVNAKEDGNHITQGDLYQDHLDEGKTIITDHEDKNDTSAVSNTVTINVDDNATGDVTIKDANIDNSCGRYDTEKNGITVDTKSENAKANITLDNVTIKPGEDGDGGNNYGGAGLEVKGDGTANIELNGDNTLNGGIYHAGVEKDDTKGTGNLIIKDDYNDDGTEKSEEEKKNSPTGSLTANGGFDAAGIGSGDYDHTSNIEISGGKVVVAAAMMLQASAVPRVALQQTSKSAVAILQHLPVLVQALVPVLMMIVRIPDGIPPVLRSPAAPFKQLPAPVPVLAPVSRATMLILRSPAVISRPNQDAVQASALVTTPKRALRSKFPARIL